MSVELWWAVRSKWKEELLGERETPAPQQRCATQTLHRASWKRI